jgi:Cu2+-containing amine oxidase
MTRPIVAFAFALSLLAASSAASAQPASRRLAAVGFNGATSAVLIGRFRSYCPNAFTQTFGSGSNQTAWAICWHEVAGMDSVANPNGLVIGPVSFRTSPTASWQTVIYDLRISEFFVPYHTGSHRYYDLSGFNFVLAPLTSADCPTAVGGATLSAHVCSEVHDRGIDFIDALDTVRRGQELVLWGAIDADNYRYIEEYTFRDDGIIVARSAATGQNLPTDELEPHVHNPIWRIDLDVDRPVNDPTLMQHVEDPGNAAGTATDSMTTIATAQGFPWAPQSVDSIVVADTGRTNKRGHNPSYHFMPLVTGGGLTHHYEDFTHNDFWVTRYISTQMAAKNLGAYVAAHDATAHNDVVVWYKGSIHHHPRDEDGAYNAGVWQGTAHTMWTGFMMVPNGVFDCSPFYGPCP